MKKTFSSIVILILLLSTANKAHSFTCGTKFFSKGDLDFEVLNDCGEPISREVIGYTLSEDQKREYKIERWVYGPIAGFYKVLTFKAGVLENEQWIRKR